MLGLGFWASGLGFRGLGFSLLGCSRLLVRVRLSGFGVVGFDLLLL